MAQPTKKKLFIVEDTPAWQAVLEAKIASGYEYKIFDKGEDAAADFAWKPDIVLLDHDLAGEWDGLKTLKEMRKKDPNIRVVMFSGQDSVQRAVEILDNGAYDYVVKGVGDTETALIRLKNILKNMEEADAIKSQVIELRLSIERWRLALYGMIAFIIVMSFSIYLNTCPQGRALKWDPFGHGNTKECQPYEIPTSNTNKTNP